MSSKFATLAVGLFCLGTFGACILDPKDTPDPDPVPPVEFKDLSEKWHVLHNLEASYNQRNDVEYDQLIDANFTFFFSPEDFSSGRTPETWDRSLDVPATQRLLADAISIDLDVQFDQLQWVLVVPDAFPNEVWSTTTVNYTFTMRFNRDPETTFITSGQPQTQFSVREVDVDGEKRWRLVEWRDRAGAFFASSIPSPSARARVCALFCFCHPRETCSVREAPLVPSPSHRARVRRADFRGVQRSGKPENDHSSCADIPRSEREGACAPQPRGFIQST